MLRTLLFIAPTFPHPVSTYLTDRGCVVVEAQSVDEALPLSPEVDAVIVAEGPMCEELKECRQPVEVNLTIHAKGPDVFFELSCLLPSPPTRLQ
jgi:hypothetical protein